MQVQNKTPKLKYSNGKHTAKTNSTNITLDVNFSIISYGNSHSLYGIVGIKNKIFNLYLQSFFQYFSQIKYNSIILLNIQIEVTL